MGKKLNYFIIALVIFGGLGFLAYRYFQGYLKTTSDFKLIPWKRVAPTSLSPEATPISAEGLIENQVGNTLAKKHGKTLSETKVKVEKFTAYFAQGTFGFNNEAAGNWWLAGKEKGGWLLVAEGRETVSCEEIEGYNFPNEMVPQCYSQRLKKLIKR